MPFAVKTNEYQGGSGVNVPTSAGLSLALVQRAFVDDITDLRTQFAALLAKLDADSGVNDTDFASSLALATQQVTKA